MSKNTLLASLLSELAAGPSSADVLAHTQAHTQHHLTGVENEEVSKIDRARGLMKSMITDEDFDRQEILDKLMSSLNITLSTATSYFQRIAKEMGLTNLGAGKDKGDSPMVADDETVMSADDTEEELPADQDIELVDQVPQSDDPQGQGVIRVIKNAHMIYKRQNEEGTFDELWIYNIQNKMQDELEIRRDILAGTDIPPRRQSSEDGKQSYRLTTIGNAQYLEITGLPQ